MSLKIKTTAGELTVDHGLGESLLGLARDAGLQINARCASEGVCGGCTVILEQGEFVVADREITVSPEKPRRVLACQTQLIGGDATVRFPRNSIIEKRAKIDEEFSITHFEPSSQTRKFLINVPMPGDVATQSMWHSVQTQLRLESGHEQLEVPADCLRKLPESLRDGGQQLTVTVGRIGRRWSVIDIEPGDTRESHLGVAVDIGTTTVVAMLVDLNQGTVLKRASLYNQQIRLADDVASRISLCRGANHVLKLQRLVVDDTLNRLIETLCGELRLSASSISRVAVSGNTVMAHLFLGISPESIGHVPFQPVANHHDTCRAGDLQLGVNPNGLVDVVPSVSGYVGGDIVSDIYVAKLSERLEPTLLVDIGTNGEMVYAENGRYSVSATAAGPAFEGYGTTHGCRAAAGAIEHIEFERGLHIETDVIGGGCANGICGSAFIDFIACGMRCGLIDHMGRYDIEQLHGAGRYLRIEEMCGSIHACVIVDAERSASGEAISISEADVAQILKAKAAIYAGMKTLLGVREQNFAGIERFCLAGGFARHINLRNAICIGLLPEIPLDRFDVLGNGSLAGAMLALVDADAMDAYEAIAKLPDVVELNRAPSFEDHFIDALAVPNLDPDEFPGVCDNLNRTC